MIRVLIVDDNAFVRRGLAAIINGEPDMEVIAEAGSGSAALAFLEDSRTVDIALIDYNMPEMDGIELTGLMRRNHPGVRVIILTMHLQSTFRDKAFAAGAAGYLLKGEDEKEMFTGIRTVDKGHNFVSKAFTA